MPLLWVNVRSTLFRRVALAGDRAPFTLWLNLLRGGYLAYSPVPPSLFWQLINAGSKGRFYNSQIKGRFFRVNADE